MKNCTDIEQSKKLAEILPLESADMRIGNYVGESGKVDGTNIHYYRKDETFGAPEIIKAWSLAALLDILSKTAHSIDEDGSVDLCDYKNIEWSLCLTNTSVGLVTANNPVDACYQMIIKLHEIKMLCL